MSLLYIETVESDAISGWTDEDQPQIWSSHYSSTYNYLHYLSEVRMRATSAWGRRARLSQSYVFLLRDWFAGLGGKNNGNIKHISVVTQDKLM